MCWHLATQFTLAVLVGVVWTGSLALAEVGGRSRTVWLDLDNLHLAKQLWQTGDRITTNQVNRLLELARDKLHAGQYSVVYSPEVAPSGDPHDYLSYGAYWWPNPDTPDGLPWIRRDGHSNPNNVVDGKGLGAMRSALESLSLAYFFTDDEQYAGRAAELLRVWFLDEATYMNPSNEYAMTIPGYGSSFDVAGFGSWLPMIYDAASILEGSSSWTEADRKGLQDWTRQFLEWAKTSTAGLIQFRDPANHGTNYDFLMALMSAYVGDEAGVRASVEHFATNRLPGQLAANGSNVFEIRRANNLLYHWYNLGRSFDLAAVASNVDGTIDLFEYQTADGRSIRLALDYILPYLTLEQEWDQWPGEAFRLKPQIYFELLRRAADFYQDPLLIDAADSLGQPESYYFTKHIDLTHPRKAVAEMSGDFNADGALSVADIDLMAKRLLHGQYYGRYDLNADALLDLQDRQWLIERTFQSTFGDADLDGYFNSSDLVLVFVTGQYRDLLERNSSWTAGDWNGDQEFDEADILLAFEAGRYEQPTVAAVPEASSYWLAVSAGLCMSPRVLRSARVCRRYPSWRARRIWARA